MGLPAGLGDHIQCGGLEQAVREALQTSGKLIPWQVVTIGVDGTILDD